MAHAVRQDVAPPRKKKASRAKKLGPAEEGVFRDVIALDIPPNRVIGTFPVDVRVKDLPRMEPTIIFEPDDEAE